MKSVFTGIIFFILLLALPGGILASTLNFDPTTITANPDETFDVNVVVNAGSEKVLAVDSWVVYDGSILQPLTVTNGTYFPTVFNNIFSGKVYVAGIADDATNYKTGSGTLGTIKFKALKNGSGKLTFYCVDKASDSSKILRNDINSTNTIECANDGTLSYTIGSGSGTNPGGTTPVVTPVGGTAPGTGNLTPLPTSLPKTGFIEATSKFTVPAVLLLLVGVGIKFLL